MLALRSLLPGFGACDDGLLAFVGDLPEPAACDPPHILAQCVVNGDPSLTPRSRIVGGKFGRTLQSRLRHRLALGTNEHVRPRHALGVKP